MRSSALYSLRIKVKPYQSSLSYRTNQIAIYATCQKKQINKEDGAFPVLWIMTTNAVPHDRSNKDRYTICDVHTPDTSSSFFYPAWTKN